MRPLSSSFPDDSLSTLDLFMKQTKETRVFWRAQALREVAAGQTVKAVSRPSISPTPLCANGCSALLMKAPRVSWTDLAAAGRLN